MVHPIGNQYRNDKVSHARVASISKGCGGGMASGGSATGGKRIHQSVQQAALRAEGGAVKARADRPGRARGGRLGKKKSGKGHTVNVIVAPSAPKPPMPPMIPGVAAGPPPGAALPPRPMTPPAGGPIAAPGAAPPGAGPMPPPGALPPPGIRYAGGRTYKKGGAVFSGAQLKASSTATRGGVAGSNKADSQTAGAGVGRTPMQHSGNKQDGKNIGRKPVITKATGGPITSKYGHNEGMAPKPPGGGGGGKERKWAAAKAAKSGYGSATVHAQNPTRDP